jgi:hypothetical protein
MAVIPHEIFAKYLFISLVIPYSSLYRKNIPLVNNSKYLGSQEKRLFSFWLPFLNN